MVGKGGARKKRNCDFLEHHVCQSSGTNSLAGILFSPSSSNTIMLVKGRGGGKGKAARREENGVYQSTLLISHHASPTSRNRFACCYILFLSIHVIYYE